MSRKTLAAATILAAVTLTAGAAAAAPVPIAPTMPRPRFADKPPIVRNYILALLLGAAVAAPNFIPSKRGHQD